ncbi:MAG: nucleoside deaminase [Planctomycetota bacterium]|jgi:tRNA(Arg) A34 adenosine deaminase TadA
MDEAARLAREGVAQGEGGPFGAVVVRDGGVVGAAGNRVLADRDPTAHAEILAIRDACRQLGRIHLNGCEIYTTCEPCPMCLAAIHWARLDRVYYVQTRDDAAAAGFMDRRLYEAMQEPQVPLVRIVHAGAAAALRLWMERPDRTPY